MSSNLKALLIRNNTDKDLGDILQIGRSEAYRIFRNPGKVKVVEVLNSKFGTVLVVQNSEVVSGIGKTKQ
jgi:hypothetical protein